jgi:TonB family protein
MRSSLGGPLRPAALVASVVVHAATFAVLSAHARGENAGRDEGLTLILVGRRVRALGGRLGATGCLRRERRVRRQGEPRGSIGRLGDDRRNCRFSSTPAELLASAPAVYPRKARAAEIECDVPVEIIVDASGAVVSASSASRAGYALDEAAVRAVRGYRFSLAMRQGHAARIRMRWVVQLRLRQ